MRQRDLGTTGLSVTELSLGTWGLSGDGYGPVEETEQDAVIERARASGINLFDTADSYAQGKMEERLGERLGSDEKALFVTKVGTDRTSRPPKKQFSKEFLSEAIDASRKRLKRDVLDIVLLHNPSARVFEKGHAVELLNELEEKGTLRAWGASVSRGELGKTAIEAGAQVLALPYNAFFPAELDEVSELAKDKGVGLLAHSVLAYGLLCAAWSRFKVFQPGDHRKQRWNSDQLRKRVEQVSAMRTLMGDEVMSARAGALRFVLHNERIASAILGPRSTMQLDQLVREAGKGPPYLAEDRLERLNTRLSELGVTQ